MIRIVSGVLLVECASALAQARDLVALGQELERHREGPRNASAFVESERIVQRCEDLSSQLEECITRRIRRSA